MYQMNSTADDEAMSSVLHERCFMHKSINVSFSKQTKCSFTVPLAYSHASTYLCTYLCTCLCTRLCSLWLKVELESCVQDWFLYSN